MTAEADHSALMARIADGDRDAFGDLYRLLEKPIYRFLTSKLNDPFEAGDLLHEVFMEVWRSAGRFEGRSTVRTWMMGIAYRKAMDRFRKSSRTQLTDEVPDMPDDAAPAVERIAEGQESGHLRACIDELSAPQRYAVELAFFEELTYREIADAAGVPEGTIKTRVYHAKQLLKRCLTLRMGRDPR